MSAPENNKYALGQLNLDRMNSIAAHCGNSRKTLENIGFRCLSPKGLVSEKHRKVTVFIYLRKQLENKQKCMPATIWIINKSHGYLIPLGIPTQIHTETYEKPCKNKGCQHGNLEYGGPLQSAKAKTSKSQCFRIFAETHGKTNKNQCPQPCFPLAKVTVIRAPFFRVGGWGSRMPE